MIYEQRSRNLWLSRIIGLSFVSVVVFILYAAVLLVFGGDLFWFALVLAVALAIMLVGYLRTDRWILDRFSDQFITPSRHVRELLEEMAIAAGIPTPVLYVIDTGTLNAFAVGREPSAGVVVVTKGLVEALSDDELRAVLAHEVAHIRDGDSMAGGLMAMTAYVANRIPTISLVFLRVGIAVASADEYAAAVALAFATAVCWLLPPFARLAQMAFGRSREFLADNDAVLLTRDPEALIGALEKIDERATVVLRAGLATSHLFIASPRPWWNSELISTHPPIEKRIERLKHVTAVPVA